MYEKAQSRSKSSSTSSQQKSQTSFGSSSFSVRRQAKKANKPQSKDSYSTEAPEYFGLIGIPIQAKLTIGEAGDKYEQEADRVASQVVKQINAPAPQPEGQSQSVQREATPEEEGLRTKPQIGTIQREVLPAQELQMKPISTGNPIGNGSSNIQRFELKDKAGNSLSDFNTDNLKKFNQSLNALEQTENPITFVSNLIRQLKSAAPKDDKNIKQALELCYAAQSKFIQSSESLNTEDIDIKEVISLKEFDDLIRDSDVSDKHLVDLVANAKTLATSMINILKSVNKSDMEADDKMQTMTEFGDAIMEQVMNESMKLYDKPKYGMAVYATGGFGRGETSPGSDLDFGVVGDDQEQELIRNITDLMVNKINLARGILAQSLGLKDGVKAGFEADTLWLQHPGSVTPENVAKNSANKGTPEDARLSASSPNSGNLQKRFEKARRDVRNPEETMSALGDIVENYNNLKLKENQVNNIKEPWIRLIALSMQKLGGVLPLEATGTVSRINEMLSNKQLDPELGKNLTSAFLTLMEIRQQLHSSYKGEKDEFFIGENPPSGIIALTHQQKENLEKAIECLKDYKSKLQKYVSTKDIKALRSGTPDTEALRSGTLRGKIASLFAR